MNTTRIQELLGTIQAHNEAYRSGNPIVSDAEYDQEVAELKALDPDNEWFKHPEPAIVGRGRKIKLPIPMKSLNKVKSLQELKQWAANLALTPATRLVVMPKYDGVSWLHDEKLNKTYSRGGAENEGQDCTSHFIKGGFDRGSAHNDFPASYTFGELVFSRNSWNSNMAGRNSDATGEPYRSPRNTVAGFINRDEAPDDIRYASFVRYGVDEYSLGNWSSFADLLDDLSIEYNQFHHADKGMKYPFFETELQQLSGEMLFDLFATWQHEYYIDGLVIYIDDLNLWKVIGRQQISGNPLYAIAYKHPDFTDSFETTVKGVDWKVSKAGALKPVVNIEGVDTGDCIMENPTGYNARYIFGNGIGPGAKILVTRSGGVIPKILNVIEEARATEMMALRNELLYCPDCGKPTSWNESAAELVCTNPDCPGVRLAKIVHFYKTLGAEQMGEETITKLFNAGYDTLRRLLDITFEELLLIDGFGEAIANNILAANKNIREGVAIDKLMHASDCFQGIGQAKAKSILTGMSKTALFSLYIGCYKVEDDVEQTERFQKLGKTGQAFVKGLPAFYDFVAVNKLKILPMEVAVKTVGNKCAGMKVCFTGIRDKELEKAITSEGGEIVNGVSKKTTHLIVPDLSFSSTKTEKAKGLGIPIFTVLSFKSL